jgi:ketosteroid isomerase-like protein
MTTADIDRLEDERYAAMLTKDVAALERLLHPDLVYMHSSGASDSKDSYVKAIGDRTFDYKQIDRSEQVVKVAGPVALVFSRLKMRLTAHGAPRNVDSRALAVWVQDGGDAAGAWRLIALQSGMVPPAT